MKLSTRSQCFFVCVVSLLAQLVPLTKSSGQRQLSPTETVDRYLTAKEAQRWSEAARYLDLDALQVKRDTMLKYAAEPRRVHHLTPEELMKHDSTMPRAVAEYNVRKMEEMLNNPRTENAWSFDFADVADISKLRTMTPLELGASWTRAHDGRYRMSLNAGNVPGCDSSSLSVVFTEIGRLKPIHRILGAVVIDSIAYVLSEDRTWRQTDSATEARPRLEFPPQVYPLRKVRGEWKVYPGDVEAGMMGLSCGVSEDEGALN